jgi:hypothetical protein
MQKKSDEINFDRLEINFQGREMHFARLERHFEAFRKSLGRLGRSFRVSQSGLKADKTRLRIRSVFLDGPYLDQFSISPLDFSPDLNTIVATGANFPGSGRTWTSWARSPGELPLPKEDG